MRLYYEFSDTEDVFDTAARLVQRFLLEQKKLPNDICVLAHKTEYVRELDDALRKYCGTDGTTSVCETKADYVKICQHCWDEIDDEDLRETLSRRFHRYISDAELAEEKNRRWEKHVEMDLRTIRRTKKRGFRMGADTVKCCTIHSFKGWEADTVFLFIDGNERNDELIYTAITRARQNLIILLNKNRKYRTFFMDAQNGMESFEQHFGA